MQGEGGKGGSGTSALGAAMKGSAQGRGRSSELVWERGPEASAPNSSQVSLCRTRSLRGQVGGEGEGGPLPEI